jgi:hypothetical protein
MVVLPTPGPPVMTSTFDSRARRMAASWPDQLGNLVRQGVAERGVRDDQISVLAAVLQAPRCRSCAGRTTFSARNVGCNTCWSDSADVRAATNALFGSDIMAETLHASDIPWIALTTGASYRGPHDSLVNHLDNENLRTPVCLHE